MDQWLQYVYMLLTFDAGIIIFVIYWEFIRKRGMMKVRIKTPLGEKNKWIKPQDDGKTLIIRKKHDRKNIPEWSATFTNKSLVTISRFLFRKAFAVDIFYDAPKCIEYDYSLKATEQPKWTKKESKAFIDAEVLRQRGRGLKQETPMIFWVLVILVIANLGLSAIIAQRMGLF